MAEVIAINVAAGVAITDDDTIVHITDFIDADGNRCAEDSAVAAVGHDYEGKRWWSIDLSKFERGFKQ